MALMLTKKDIISNIKRVRAFGLVIMTMSVEYLSLIRLIIL